MSTASHRFLTAAPFLALMVVAACGGKTSGGAPDGGGLDSGGPDTGVFTEPDGAICVEIDLSTFDLSCTTSSDCISVLNSGTHCSGTCDCGGSTISKSGEARYAAVIAQIKTADCPCLAAGEPACVRGECKICGFDSADPACGGDGGVSDGGNGADASSCVEVDLADYDQSCVQASDCIDILTGSVCDGSCSCGGSPVNKSGEAKYEAAVAGVKFAECPCVSPGQLACVHGACTHCGFDSGADGGCGDGG